MTSSPSTQTIVQNDSQFRPGAFQRLLVPVDNSRQSVYAVDLAGRMARQDGTQIFLLNVYSLPDNGLAPAAVSEDERSACIEEANYIVSCASERLPRELSIECIVREGNPVSQILWAVEHFNADLIIMGSHPHGRLAEVVFGSVSREVAQKSPVPVLTLTYPPVLQSNITAQVTTVFSRRRDIGQKVGLEKTNPADATNYSTPVN